MLSAQRRIRCFPTLVEPVKLTLRITRLAISVSLTRPLSPWTSWATPFGIPASASARNDGAARGECGADLLREQVDREVPRSEGCGRTDRLADHARNLARGTD